MDTCQLANYCCVYLGMQVALASAFSPALILPLLRTTPIPTDLNQGVFVETLRQQHLHNRMEWLQVGSVAV